MTAPSLAEKIVAIHRALDAGGIPHAFGGALALAYLTEEPRATKDVDVNVFVPVDQAERVLSTLPRGVRWTTADVDAVRGDAQVRLWWEHTPVDLFFDVDEIHRQAAAHARVVAFAGTELPVLDGNELAVFKMMFSRPKDWVDIAEMLRAGTLDVDAVSTAFGQVMGPHHEALDQLRELAATTRPAGPPGGSRPPTRGSGAR